MQAFADNVNFYCTETRSGFKSLFIRTIYNLFRMHLKQIDTLLHLNVGAPNPVGISDERKLNLLYYYEKELSYNKEFLRIPRQRETRVDTGVAILTFKGVIIHKFGYPNDEVLLSHRYSLHGFLSYELFEVLESDWTNEIVEMNSIHPYHNADRYKNMNHYVIAFKDSTFECVAEIVKLDFIQKTLHEAIAFVADSFS